jgi:hypothetical protein
MPRGALPAIGFQPQFLDFDRGIRVGNLEEHERITRILKQALETRYGEEFVTERWGRGVFWQWIGFLSRANRAAKPVSSHVSFGCSKFFLSVNTSERVFECGMQVERGFLKAPAGHRQFQVQDDWDWHRLLKALKPRGPMESKLARLLREGFMLHAGAWESDGSRLSREEYPGLAGLRRRLSSAPAGRWAGFQLFYPMSESEVRSASGPELVESMLAVFREVTPAMNLCMQTQLSEAGEKAPLTVSSSGRSRKRTADRSSGLPR